MKRWVLWVAVACLVAFAVWAGRAGWDRHAGRTSPSGEKTDDVGALLAAKDVAGGAEEVAAVLTEPGQVGMDDSVSQNGVPMGGKEKGKIPRTDGWDPRMGGGEESGEQARRDEAVGGEERAVNSGTGGLGRSFGSGGVGGSVRGVTANGEDGEASEEVESPTVSPEEAERIFAENDAAAAAARELRQEALKEEEEGNAEEEDRPPLWIVRSLDWDEETQEMEVSFRFGVEGDAAEGGILENGILVQRIPPSWEVQSSSPAADAFAAGSRKLKWLLSGGALAGREISLLATPTEGADPGDWDLAPTWFTCRWNGKACQVQPELGAE